MENESLIPWDRVAGYQADDTIAGELYGCTPEAKREKKQIKEGATAPHRKSS